MRPSPPCSDPSSHQTLRMVSTGREATEGLPMTSKLILDLNRASPERRKYSYGGEGRLSLVSRTGCRYSWSTYRQCDYRYVGDGRARLVRYPGRQGFDRNDAHLAKLTCSHPPAHSIRNGRCQTVEVESDRMMTVGTSFEQLCESSCVESIEDSGWLILRSDLRPVPYPIPSDGPVGQMVRALGRHVFRPAHLHFQIEVGFDD